MRITDSLQHALVAALLTTVRPEVGPFVVLLDEASDNPFRNYAAPSRPDPPTPDDVEALVALFRARARRPRLEYVEPADSLTAALLAAGFEIVRRLPLLVLGDGGVVAPPEVAGIEVGPAAEPDLLGAAEVQVAAYGDDEPASASADRLRRVIGSGGGVAAARDLRSGRIVGAGLHAAPAAGFAEIAAVAVDADFRRRGIGAAVAAAITTAAAATGAHPFLQAESEREAAIYARIGYERCGALVLAELPDSAEHVLR